LTAFGLGHAGYRRWRVIWRRRVGLDDRRLICLRQVRRPRCHGEGGTAGGAVLRLWPMLHTTAWTMRPQWGPTAAAKPGPCAMVCLIDVLADRTTPALPGRTRARDHLWLRCSRVVCHLERAALHRLHRPRGGRMRLLFVIVACRGVFRDGCHKAIAMTVERLNDPLLLPAIAYGPAHRSQCTLQRRVTDELLGPHLFAQLLLVHEALTVRQKV